jgi:hypothetical protein
LPGFVGLRGNLAVGRIGNEPRPAVFREVILEPVQRAPQFPPLPIGFDTLVAPLGSERGQLAIGDLFKPSSIELRGPLERNQALVVVRKDSGYVWITPWGSSRREGLCGGLALPGGR